MMNSWFTEMVFAANERLFREDELVRIEAYLQTVPNRLKLLEELEKNEETLIKQVYKDLQKRYPRRNLYTRRLVQDVVEGLRYVGRAILADDMRLLRSRWISHMARMVYNLRIDPTVFTDLYNVLAEHLQRTLTRELYQLIEPAIKEITAALETIQTEATS